MDSTQNTCSTLSSDEEAMLVAMQLSFASALPMVLKSAIELDLLEIMDKAGPGALLSTHEVAAQLSTTCWNLRLQNRALVLTEINK
ncbi:hypothetical protein GQ457_04G005870 [Hibiscus cannabinus]